MLRRPGYQTRVKILKIPSPGKKRKSGQGRPRAQAWTDSKEWSKPNGWLSAAALFSPSEATHNPRWLLRDPCQWPKKGRKGGEMEDITGYVG